MEMGDLPGLCRWLESEIEHHRTMMGELSRQRRAAVRAMRSSGLGYSAIAKLLGVSKGRVQQMASR